MEQLFTSAEFGSYMDDLTSSHVHAMVPYAYGVGDTVTRGERCSTCGHHISTTEEVTR